jgi:serine/threonine-protein kinase HipA
VHDGFPSTHILKPEVARSPAMIFDEEYGARIARALGLIEYATWIETFGGIRALVIERYDRATDAPTGRVHQEDLCQALGIPRTQKYQEQGGAASVDRFHALVRTHAGRDSVERLARMVVLAVAIGNVDLHAKNLALLHPFDAPATLTPAYDTVPLLHQPSDARMAFAVNGVHRHADLTIDDLEAQLGSWSAAAGGLGRPTLERIGTVVDAETPHPAAYSGLRREVAGFVSNLLAGEPLGTPSA